MGSNIEFGSATGSGTIPPGTPVVYATCPNGRYVAAYWDDGKWVELPFHDDAKCRTAGCHPEPAEWIVTAGAPTCDFGYQGSSL